MVKLNRSCPADRRVPMLLRTLFVCCLCVMPISQNVVYAQSADAQTDLLDAVGYTQIQQLRVDLVLTNRDLAAMGCTQADAEIVLSRLKAWHESNRASLEQTKQACLHARRQLRQTMLRYHTGDAEAISANTLDAHKQTIIAADEAHQALLNSVADHLAISLNSNQREVWQTAKANAQAGAPSSFRYVKNLDEQQTHELLLAMRKDSVSSVTTSLTTSQKDAVYRANQKTRDHIRGVVEAENKVFPLLQEMAQQYKPLNATLSEKP